MNTAETLAQIKALAPDTPRGREIMDLVDGLMAGGGEVLAKSEGHLEPDEILHFQAGAMWFCWTSPTSITPQSVPVTVIITSREEQEP